jgi:hypothetical protein
VIVGRDGEIRTMSLLNGPAPCGSVISYKLLSGVWTCRISPGKMFAGSMTMYKSRPNGAE